MLHSGTIAFSSLDLLTKEVSQSHKTYKPSLGLRLNSPILTTLRLSFSKYFTHSFLPCPTTMDKPPLNPHLHHSSHLLQQLQSPLEAETRKGLHLCGVESLSLEAKSMDAHCSNGQSKQHQDRYEAKNEALEAEKLENGPGKAGNGDEIGETVVMEDGRVSQCLNEDKGAQGGNEAENEALETKKPGNGARVDEMVVLEEGRVAKCLSEGLEGCQSENDGVSEVSKSRDLEVVEVENEEGKLIEEETVANTEEEVTKGLKWSDSEAQSENEGPRVEKSPKSEDLDGVDEIMEVKLEGEETVVSLVSKEEEGRKYWGWDDDEPRSVSEGSRGEDRSKRGDLDKVVEDKHGGKVTKEEEVMKYSNWSDDEPQRESEGKEESPRKGEVMEEEENKEWKFEGGGGEVKLVRQKVVRKYHQQYPVKPGEPDCLYYVKTGSCRYGFNCRFNHPSRKKNQGKASASVAAGIFSVAPEPAQFPVQVQAQAQAQAQTTTVKETNDYSEKPRLIECKYNKTGACKFGSSCRYYHPRDKTVVVAPTDFNFLGLPIRPGETECPHYMRTGACKFDINCRFHHPNPTPEVEADTPSGHNGGGSVPLHSSDTSQSTSRAFSSTSPSYPPMVYASPQGVQPKADWNGYQGSVGPQYLDDRNNYRSPAPVMNNSNVQSTHNHYQIPIDGFPERPSQPECQYFMKNGDCKYRSACRFHHPKNRSAIASWAGILNSQGLTNCQNYVHYGVCNNGPTCKYNHPPPAYNVNHYATPRGG